MSEGFLQYLLRERTPPLAPSSVNRVLATLRHTASWIHRQRPFLVENPTERVAEMTVEEPEWKGLETIQVNRLKSAAEQLLHLAKRQDPNPVRGRAVLLFLRHTSLRASELLSLGMHQYDGKHLKDIRREGKKVTCQLLLARPAREALDRYLEEVRGKEPGPLIQSCAVWRAKGGGPTSVLGVAAITTRLLLAYLPELGRLDRRQLAGLVGVAPVRRDPGHRRGARTSVRNGLYMATLAVWRGERLPLDPQLVALALVAAVAHARIMLTTLWAGPLKTELQTAPMPANPARRSRSGNLHGLGLLARFGDQPLHSTA